MALRGDGASNSHALRSIAEMRRGCGRHVDAVQILDLERIKPSPEAYVELAFLRGAHGVEWSTDARFSAKPSKHPATPLSTLDTDSLLVFA